jgi:hypothetical protein
MTQRKSLSLRTVHGHTSIQITIHPPKKAEGGGKRGEKGKERGEEKEKNYYQNP